MPMRHTTTDTAYSCIQCIAETCVTVCMLFFTRNSRPITQLNNPPDSRQGMTQHGTQEEVRISSATNSSDHSAQTIVIDQPCNDKLLDESSGTGKATDQPTNLVARQLSDTSFPVLATSLPLPPLFRWRSRGKHGEPRHIIAVHALIVANSQRRRH